MKILVELISLVGIKKFAMLQVMTIGIIGLAFAGLYEGLLNQTGLIAIIAIIVVCQIVIFAIKAFTRTKDDTVDDETKMDKTKPKI